MNRKINKIAIAIIGVIFTSGAIFYACQKDNDITNTLESRTLKNATYNFNTINIEKIKHQDGMLKFESAEHYTQTIDALVEICDQYSNNYITELETQLGCPIDEADEDIIADIMIADNFFPYDPLLDFITTIKFTNSAYPILREQEIEWLANDELFKTTENPFDAVEAGYVQSALHNSNGFVLIEGLNFDVDPESNGGGEDGSTGSGSGQQKCGFTIGVGTNNNSNLDCEKSSKQKVRSTSFKYKNKDREVRATLATTSINMRCKTTAYYRNKPSKPWILWWVRVDINFSGTKWTNCDPYDPGLVSGGKNGHAFAGLVEKYYTFNNVPTYIIPQSGTYITGEHWCRHGGTVNTEITYNN